MSTQRSEAMIERTAEDTRNFQISMIYIEIGRLGVTMRERQEKIQECSERMKRLLLMQGVELDKIAELRSQLEALKS